MMTPRRPRVSGRGHTFGTTYCRTDLQRATGKSVFGVIDGSFHEGAKARDVFLYAQVKYLGALWMSDLARRRPDLRPLTVSPGNTSGTEAFRDQPLILWTLLNKVLMPVVDQATIVADFADPAIQAIANEAIHRFIA